MKLTIEKLIYEGWGLGHEKNGRTVLVKKSAAGDELEVDITTKKKSYAEAAIKYIDKPSGQRVNPACPYFSQCGGCDYQHLSNVDQLAAKEKIFTETLERQGIELKPEPIIEASEHYLGYRNNNRFFFIEKDDNSISFGLNHYAKNQIIEVGECLLQSKRANLVLETLKQCLNDDFNNKESFWQIRIRESQAFADLMVEIITHNTSLPQQETIVDALSKIPNVKSVYHTIAERNSLIDVRRRLIYGSPIIYDQIGRFKFQISPASFFQTNTQGAKTLYDVVKRYADIKPGDTVLDLFCGTGTIGIYLSTLAKKVIGVESVPEAVNDARDNSKINRVLNCEFICEDVQPFLEKLGIRNLKLEIPTVVVADPPRAGLSQEMINALSGLFTPDLLAPRSTDKDRGEVGPTSRPSDLSTFRPKLIYVSCNPATFARDVLRFKEKGIRLEKVQPIDMFPQTHHIECVGLLSVDNHAIKN